MGRSSATSLAGSGFAFRIGQGKHTETGTVFGKVGTDGTFELRAANWQKPELQPKSQRAPANLGRGLRRSIKEAIRDSSWYKGHGLSLKDISIGGPASPSTWAGEGFRFKVRGHVNEKGVVYGSVDGDRKTFGLKAAGEFGLIPQK